MELIRCLDPRCWFDKMQCSTAVFTLHQSLLLQTRRLEDRLDVDDIPRHAPASDTSCASRDPVLRPYSTMPTCSGQARDTAEALIEARRERRRRRLDKLEIPEDQLIMTNDFLGKGGYGVVYLADLNGRNAAAKVVQIHDDLGDNADQDCNDGPGGDQSQQAKATMTRSFGDPPPCSSDAQRRIFGLVVFPP